MWSLLLDPSPSTEPSSTTFEEGVKIDSRQDPSNVFFGDDDEGHGRPVKEMIKSKKSIIHICTIFEGNLSEVYSH